MLIKEIEESELELIETLYHPRGYAEVMFSNGDNLSLFEEDKFLEIRMGQIPLLPWDYLVDGDPKLSDKENFARKEKAGSIACFAGRNFGKTFVGEKLDFCQYPVVAENESAGFASFDALHLKGVLDEMYIVWKNHPIISSFVDRIIRSPYRFTTKYGITIEGINMKIGAGSQAGDQFLQKHFKRLTIEESSHENDIVYDKRTDSVSEMGCVIRQLGMTDFVRNSPPGKVFYAPKNKWKILNLPQFINPNFDERQNQERLKKFGGKSSFGYRIFVKGEIVEDGENCFDMPLVRDLNYPHTKSGDLDEKRIIKHIELTKKRFDKYKNFVILSRPANADKIYLTADIGQQGGITEIIVIAEIKGKFRYLYNVTLINMTYTQQKEVFDYVRQLVRPDFIALDSGGGMGESLFTDMRASPKYKNVKLVWVAFNENVPVGLELDEITGKPIRKNGQLVERMVNSVEQSVNRLCHLFYEAKIFLPYDSRLDEQLDKVVAIASKATNKILYKCIAREDHLYQAFQVFAIAQWLVEYGKIGKPTGNMNRKHDKSGAI